MCVKLPERGKVKSRLAASVGEDIAADLYRCFVKDIIEMLRGSEHPFTIYFHPPDSKKSIVQWLGDTCKLLPQTGDDLGQRMKNAFCEVFSQGIGSAILIGSDSPDLSIAIIDKALSSLSGHDAVVGPSYDGGYYLIGFRADTFLPDVFDGIPWSTPDVFLKTMEIFARKGFLVDILPQWRDIDTLDDLKTLYIENRYTPFACSATMRYVENNKSVLQCPDDSQG
jgi:rSAM/selenodomain-associated transferase 1